MQKKIAACIALVCVLLIIYPVRMGAGEHRNGDTYQGDAEQTKEQLKQGLLRNEDGSLSYYEDGEMLRNTLKKVFAKGNIHYYYFRRDGRALTNCWKTINGDCYYFGKNGRAYTGKRKVGADTYYFSPKGRRQYGFKTIKGKTYYFSEKSGKMLTGKQHVSHFLCYFGKRGVLKRRIDKDGKMVALTYDDGPSIHTPKVLDALEKYDAVATFYVVGNRVSRYGDIVARADRLGCEIGNHTYEHKTLPGLNREGILAQIRKTDEAVEAIIGKRPRTMRPPGGNLNDTVKETVGKPLILWSLDTVDWRTRDTAKTRSAVLDNVRDGDIVLMHDLHLSTANAAEKIISALLDRDYQLVTVSELAECRGGMQSGSKYSQFRP